MFPHRSLNSRRLLLRLRVFYLFRYFLFLLAYCVAFASLSFSQSRVETSREVPSSLSQTQLSFAPLVNVVRPSVVNVYAARVVQQRRSPFAGDPFFEQFFNFHRRTRPRIDRSLGSGVIVGSDGIIVTNTHVIRNADEVKVALYDGREFDARILFTDDESDLAILSLSGDESFTPLPLGDSENLEVGDLVLAVGNPFGVGQTVTSGIISALARSQGAVDDFGYFIQTDASINPGNSGGALVDMTGNLVGINTSIFTRSGGSNGIGFAVPSNMVRVALDSVEAGSDTLIRPWIGARFTEVTSEIAQALGLDRPRGALVEDVLDGSPAAKAGLKSGDVVLEFDSKTVPHMQSLGYRLATAGIGRKIQLNILSNNSEQTIELALDSPPEIPLRDIRVLEARSPFQGATIANLSPKLAIEQGMDALRTGVLVLSVSRGSTASRLGIRQGDILLTINDIDITSTSQLSDYLSPGLFGSSQFTGFSVDRNGRILTRALR